MASRIIHIGADTCHRLPVLESAGYLVNVCLTVVQLREAFAAEEQLDAVLFSEAGGREHEAEFVSLARSCCSAPIVLFRETQQSLIESEFDLVVPVLDPPEEWLADVGALIRRSHELQTKSRELCKESAALRQETAEVRAKSRQERLRSRRECARNISPLEALVIEPKNVRDE